MQNLAINFLVNILIFISEYAITLLIMQSLLNVKLTFNCKNISIIILAILIMSTTDFFLHDYFFCSILIQIELIISTAFIFKPKFQDLIFSFFLEVIFVIAYQLIVVAVLNLFPIKPFGSFYQITGNLLSILFIIIFLFLSSRNSTVPALLYPTALAAFTAISPICCLVFSSRAADGDSSTIF